MAHYRQRGFGSRLSRRVQRHRATTALFRTAVEPQQRTVPGTSPVQRGAVLRDDALPIVRATLALPQSQPATQGAVLPLPTQQSPGSPRTSRSAPTVVPLPVREAGAGGMAAATPVSGETVNQRGAAQIQAVPRVQRRESPSPVPVTAPASVSPIGPGPVPPVPSPQAGEAEPVESDSTITEAVWSRLTTIFRKHREKNELETQLDSAREPEPEPVTPPPPPRPERGIIELRAPPRTAAVPGQVQRIPQRTEVPAAADGSIDPDTPAMTGEASSSLPDPGLPDIPTPSPASETEDTSGDITELVNAPDAAIEIPGAQSVAPTVQRIVEEDPGVEREVIAEVGGSGLDADREQRTAAPFVEPLVEEAAVPPAPAPAGSIQRTALSGDATADTNEVPSEREPPPLEQTLASDNAWGFQVTRTQQAIAPTVIAQREVKQLPPAPGPVKDEDHRELHAALEQVEAGRPSDSSIEVIPPRRPRPEPRNLARRTMQVQREASPEVNESEAGIAVAVADTPAAIATPIGLLPSDLWTLIGAPVPQSNEAAMAASQPIYASRTISTPQQTPPVIQRVVSETGLSALSGESPAEASQTPIVQPSHTARERPIQRAVAVNQVETQVPDQATQTTADTSQAPADRSGETQDQQDASSPPASEIDLDALAAQIYKRIKRNLGIEWERLRSRF